MRTRAPLAFMLLVSACGSSTATISGNESGGGMSSQANAGATNTGTAGASALGGATHSGGAGGAATSGSSGAASSGAGAGGATSSGGGNANNAGGAKGNAGATGSAGASTVGTEPLKGVAFSTTTGTCADLSRLGLSWYYNWGSTTKCTGIEYVPQIWGDWTALSWVPTPAKAVAGGAKELLSFNEPDGAGQANMTVAQALALWPSFDQPGVKIGSPAVAGEGWLPDFMTGVAAQNLRVDFIAVHWYGWDPGTCNDTSQLEGKIKWAEQWQRPIWITEWSCRLQPVDTVNKFYTDALAMFKNHPLVERYAWFETRSASDPNSTDFNNATLLDPSGNPTTLGNEYIAAPSLR
jgi:Glycosyl hydrolase catalytic core